MSENKDISKETANDNIILNYEIILNSIMFKLSIIRSYLLILPFDNYEIYIQPIFNYLSLYCETSDSNISFYSFQLMEMWLNTIINIKDSKEDNRFVNNYISLLKLLFNNWDNPVKVISYQIINIFTLFIQNNNNNFKDYNDLILSFCLRNIKYNCISIVVKYIGYEYILEYDENIIRNCILDMGISSTISSLSTNLIIELLIDIKNKNEKKGDCKYLNKYINEIFNIYFIDNNNNNNNFRHNYCIYLLKELLINLPEVLPNMFELINKKISDYNGDIKYEKESLEIYLYLLKYIKTLGIGSTKSTNQLEIYSDPFSERFPYSIDTLNYTIISNYTNIRLLTLDLLCYSKKTNSLPCKREYELILIYLKNVIKCCVDTE